MNAGIIAVERPRDVDLSALILVFVEEAHQVGNDGAVSAVDLDVVLWSMGHCTDRMNPAHAA